MSVRRHPVVPATIVSGFAVRAVEIAAAVNRGRCGDLDRPRIRAMADDLGRDLDRARRHVPARNLQLGTVVTRGPLPALVLGQALDYAPALSLTRGFNAAVDLAREFIEAMDRILASYLGLRLTFSHDDDLELAHELADGAGSCLDRTRALAIGLGDRPSPEQVLSTGRTISRALDQALARARAMRRVCGQGLASRLGMATADGLAEAIIDGALDDFTSADLTGASLAEADLTGMRWSLTGTTWPPGTDIKALLARSETQPGGVLMFRHRGTMWQPNWR
jgi:hypothetical protein